MRNRKSLQTDGRTEAKGYNISRPFFKGAHKKCFKSPLSFFIISKQ